MIRFHHASPADYATIRRLAHATWPDTFGNILSTDQIDYMLRRMYDEDAIRRQVAEGHRFVLLQVGQAARFEAFPNADYTRYVPVGYLSYQLDHLPRTTKVHKLYVLPAEQKKGYGRALLQHAETTARAAGQTALRLDVNYQNPAVAFYHRLGFRTIARHDTDIGEGYLMEDFVLEKSL